MEGVLRAAAPMLLLPSRRAIAGRAFTQLSQALSLQQAGAPESVSLTSAALDPQPCPRCVSRRRSTLSSSALWSSFTSLPCITRSFSSTAAQCLDQTSSSTDKEEVAQQSNHDPSTKPQHALHGAAWPVWDWSFVAGDKKGRKPAIKKPKRHQWLFCNPTYNPHQQLPPKILSPYAPTTAQQQDEWQVYRKLKPTHRQKDNKRYREQFMRWLALRDIDWRNAFSTGVSQDIKQLKNTERLQLRQQRQAAWESYKASLLQLEPGSQETADSSTSRTT